MSRIDWETEETLITPHIEIGKGNESLPDRRAHVNAETFKRCLGKLILPRNESGPKTPKSPFYSIYGVVSNPVGTPELDSYVNISEPPISRTLMGYLEGQILKEELPNTYRILNSIKVK